MIRAGNLEGAVPSVCRNAESVGFPTGAKFFVYGDLFWPSYARVFSPDGHVSTNGLYDAMGQAQGRNVSPFSLVGKQKHSDSTSVR